jgi:hypothetical protein
LKNSNKLGSMEAKWYRARIATGFGYQQDCQRPGNATDDLLKRKSKRRNSYSRRDGSVELAELAVGGEARPRRDPVELFQRFLRITQGLEAPRDGLESSAKHKPILPYFVLGGLQGL